MPILRGHVNDYLVKGDKGWLLVDTTWDTEDAFKTLTEELKEIGLNFKNITQIIITHVHPDHYGLAEKIKQLSGAKLALHQREKSLIEQRYVNPYLALHEIEEWFCINGMSKGDLSELYMPIGYRKPISPAFPEIVFSGGEKISWGAFNFEIFWTPGHSPGHICLYEAKRKIFFAGDHILPSITPHIGLCPGGEANPLFKYLESLQFLRELNSHSRISIKGFGKYFTTIRREMRT